MLFGGSIAAIGQIQQGQITPSGDGFRKNAQGASGYNGPKPANEGIWARGGIGKSYPIAQNNMASTECKRPAVRRALVAKWCAVRESNPRPWD